MIPFEPTATARLPACLMIDNRGHDEDPGAGQAEDEQNRIFHVLPCMRGPKVRPD
jgi:hypothetical protein